MATNSMELMKKLIEDKKNKNTKQNTLRPNAQANGSTQKAFKTLKRGGAFDK
ncbi:MAG: hypothetical protein AB9856_02330 [Cellulosilyticaceae bacterium]